MKFGVIISINAIPTVIAGPLIRHVSQHQLTFWLVTNKPYTMQFQLYAEDLPLVAITLNAEQHQKIRIGEHAIVNLLSINFPQALPLNTLLDYNFSFIDDDQQQSLVELMPELFRAKTA